MGKNTRTLNSKLHGLLETGKSKFKTGTQWNAVTNEQKHISKAE